MTTPRARMPGQIRPVGRHRRWGGVLLSARPLGPLGLALLLSGCGLFFKNPVVRIAQVDITRVGLTGATAQVDLEVVNPNGFGLTARELRYRLDFQEGEAAAPQWRTLSEGTVDRELRVEARDTAVVQLEVPFAYSELGAALVQVLRTGELEYRLTGDVRFNAPVGTMRVPFDRTGLLEP